MLHPAARSNDQFPDQPPHEQLPANALVRRGADFLFQVRYTVPNGKFDSGFTDFFKADLSFISAALST
jgi:hypothetical protein